MNNGYDPYNSVDREPLASSAIELDGCEPCYDESGVAWGEATKSPSDEDTMLSELNRLMPEYNRSPSGEDTSSVCEAGRDCEICDEQLSDQVTECPLEEAARKLGVPLGPKT